MIKLYHAARTRSVRIYWLLEGKTYLLGSEFSGADIMLGFSLHVAESFDLLSGSLPNLSACMDRLKARPAFRKAFGAT